MTRDEVRWRAATWMRAAVQQAAARLRTPRWQRHDILHVLNPAMQDSVRDAVATRRWTDVHHRIASRLQSRPARFVLDPSTREQMRLAVLAHDPGAAGHAHARADRIASGEFDLLGYRALRFARAGHRIDWHFDPVYGRGAPRAFYTRVPYLDPVIGDHKIIWELNRHQHWLALGRATWLTGDARYARAILAEMHDWLEANPPLVGINWASMLEVGFRVISWTWALHCLLAVDGAELGTRDSGLGTRHSAPRAGDSGLEAPASGLRTGNPDPNPDPWLVDMLVGLARQLAHIEQNLSYYFSPNTHLTGEALALYVAGAALPELAGAERWMTTGRAILLDEIDRQILPDGGHAERSFHYQRYTLDFYLLALLTARRIGDDGATSRFADAAARLAEFTRVVADEEGRLPLIGDDDGGMLWPIAGRPCNDVRDSLAIAATALNRAALAPWGVPEEAIWVSGPDAVAACAPADDDAPLPVVSRAFEESGYVVLRNADGDHAVFDTGPHGFHNAGHAHADALALTLTLGRRPLLIDPGTSTYTMDGALRDRLRSSASHNTVTVDGRSPSVPAGPFHWHSRTDGRLEAWRRNGAFDFAEGAHDGYALLRHRRAIARIDDGSWFIADDIDGAGPHTAAAYWHFDPAWRLLAEPGRVRAVHSTGDAVWLLHDAPHAELLASDHDSGLGWYAPVYGTLVPATAVRAVVDGNGPLQLITWIGGEGAWPSPRLRRVATDARVPRPIAAEVSDGRRRALFVVRPGGTPSRVADSYRIDGHEIDARFLHCRADGDRLVRLDLADVIRVASSRHGWLSLDADAPLADLHVGVEHGFIDLRASTPSATLRLHGVPPTHRVRVNGRECAAPPAGAATDLVIHPTDWHTVAAHLLRAPV